MAYCENCGQELKEGAKFCPECGAAVKNEGNMEGKGHFTENRYEKYEAPNTNEPSSFLDKYGNYAGIALLILAFVSFSVKIPVLRILMSVLLIGGSIFCLVRKYRQKKMTIAALILSVLCLAGGTSRANKPATPDPSGSKPPAQEKQELQKSDAEVKPTATEAPAETPKPTATSAPTEEPAAPENNTEEQADVNADEDKNSGDEEGAAPEQEAPAGVNPELKAFLDSYESFMDEYIEFMVKYQNSDNAAAMIVDYLDFMTRYADFAEKVDQYDTDEMSNEDAIYYIEVTSRCSQKMLEALG